MDDDMFGDLEKDDAQVVPINSHPEFRSYTPPEFQIGTNEQQGDEVDAAMIEILEQAASETLEERNAIGNNVCWLCTHRVDRRPLWKRILFTPNEMSYLCGATKRTEVADPVSGQIRWIERARGMLGGTQLILVDTPHRPCVEMNPDGKCQRFNIALSERKKR